MRRSLEDIICQEKRLLGEVRKNQWVVEMQENACCQYGKNRHG